jgi:hypothetical protein
MRPVGRWPTSHRAGDVADERTARRGPAKRSMALRQAQFLLGPSRRQAGAVLLSFGVPGDDGGGMEGGMNPADEAQPPIDGIQADHARVKMVEMYGPLQR